MKRKNLLFPIAIAFSMIFGCSLSLMNNQSVNKAKADDIVDVGSIKLSHESSIASGNTPGGIYVLADVSNDFPFDNANWTTRLYSSEANSLIVNGVDISSKRAPFVKHQEKSYYIGLLDVELGERQEDDTVVIQGNWRGTVNGVTYNLYVERAEFVWQNNKWAQKYVIPELEYYDEISLANLSMEDYYKESINTEHDPSSNNTYMESVENTTRSFVFKFYIETYTKMTQTLDFRIGSTQSWDSGHYFHACLNGDWGPNGVVVFHEKLNGVIINKGSDANIDLRPGARHLVEIGCIAIKNSNERYVFTKFDNEYYIQTTWVLASDIPLTTKIGVYYGSSNIFLGNAVETDAPKMSLDFSQSNGDKGIYFTSEDNDLPYSTDWTTRGALQNRYNVLLNGDGVYNRGATPLVKYGQNEYYIVFSDYNFTFKEGDIISIGGEFHFYNQNAYHFNISPIHFMFENGRFVEFDIYEYMMNNLNALVDFSLYDDDKIPQLQGILERASLGLENFQTIRDLWVSYQTFIEEIESVPMNEEKAREKLEQYKASAIQELQDMLNPNVFEEESLALATEYVNEAIIRINNSASIAEIKEIVNDTKELINALPTKEDKIVEKILNLEEGYEQYLALYDVITTSDLYAMGDLNFYAFGSENQSFSTPGDKDGFANKVPCSPGNEKGNMIIKFKYKSSDPLSSKYGSQVFIRARGSITDAYQFRIANELEGKSGVTILSFINDVVDGDTIRSYPAGFQANQEYEIECGALDLKDYNKTFLYIKIDGQCVVNEIVKSLDLTDPKIIICDSFLADDSDAVTTLSPIEEGTTKHNYATKLGRLIYDGTTGKDNIFATSRNNSIPVGSELYPVENGAFTINGNIVPGVKPMIIKTGDNQYRIALTDNKIAIKDNDVVSVGGLYSYYDSVSNKKYVYSFSKTSYSYNESSNLWTQESPSLEDAKAESIDLISEYVDLNDYSEANKEVINQIIDETIENITGATTVDDVYTFLEAGIDSLEAVPTLLDDYKSDAINQINSYKNLDLYREAEQNQLRDIIANATNRIRAAQNQDEVDLILIEVKAQMDAVKTNEQYEAEELASAKTKGKTEIEIYTGLLDMDRYNEENWANISNLAIKARSDIDNASSKEEVEQIVAKFKEDVKNVQTNDGSTFNGETYIEPVKPDKKKGGCGGSIISTSIILTAISGIAICLLILKKRNAYLLRK